MSFYVFPAVTVLVAWDHPREVLCQTFLCSNDARKCFALWQATSPLYFLALKTCLSTGLKKLAYRVGITNGLVTGSSKTTLIPVLRCCNLSEVDG